MLRYIGLCLLLPMAGCALHYGAPAWSTDASPGTFDFNWQLSGDAAVAPLQVFGTQRETWLQFEPGHPVPALFASTPQGDRPLAYRRQDPYVIVDGRWPRLTLRGGRHVAHATRGAAVPQTAMPAWQAVPHPAQAELVSQMSSPDAASPVPSVTSAPVLAPAGRADAAKPVRIDTPASLAYRAGPPDATLRAVLGRWASASGWTFQPQHWAVDVDIPLAGSADFDGDFRDAVRALLSSTELTERPVQPCFYANRVLRVVPYTQACDRTVVRGGGAS